MTSKAFFDTNILIYAASRNDYRHEAALGLLASGGTISTQVLNETADVLKRKLKWDWEAIRSHQETVLAICPDPVALTVPLHMTAIGLAMRFGFRMYDACIVAAAAAAGCSTLFSEDMQDGRDLGGGLSVVNPFKSLAH